MGNWISVKERLPAERVDVLIAIKWGKIPIQAFYSTGVWFGSTEVTDYMIDGYVGNRRLQGDFVVTHWMPLPKVPKD